jgi:hypothetical protein
MLIQSRPLWQLLLAVRNDNKTPLTCAECFSILEYLAELKVEEGHGRVLRAVQRHLNICSECGHYVDSRLQELEKSANA